MNKEEKIQSTHLLTCSSSLSWEVFHPFICPLFNLSVYSSINFSIYLSNLSVHPCVRLSIHPFVHLFIHVSLLPYICSFLHSFVHPFICSFVCSSGGLSTNCFICSSICLSINLSIHPSIHRSIYSFIRPLIHLFVGLSFDSLFFPSSVNLSIYPSVGLSTSQFIHLFVHPLVNMTVHLLTSFSVHPFIHPFVQVPDSIPNSLWTFLLYKWKEMEDPEIWVGKVWRYVIKVEEFSNHHAFMAAICFGNLSRTEEFSEDYHYPNQRKLFSQRFTTFSSSCPDSTSTLSSSSLSTTFKCAGLFWG